MNFENKLESFEKKHNLSFQKQVFQNCYNGDWVVNTYSLFNSSGCFTIHYLLQRNEFEFFFSNCISNNRTELREKEINVFEYHKEMWKSKSKIFFFPIPFFYENIDKVISTLVDIMEIDAKEKNEIFGIKL